MPFSIAAGESEQVGLIVPTASAGEFVLDSIYYLDIEDVLITKHFEYTLKVLPVEEPADQPNETPPSSNES